MYHFMHTSCCDLPLHAYLSPLRRVLLPFLQNPPTRYKRQQTEASQPLACKLNKVASASVCVCTNHSYVCIYHVLQSHACLGGILLDSLQFLTLKGTEQHTGPQVQPHGCWNYLFGPLATFLPTEPCQWLVVLP